MALLDQDAQYSRFASAFSVCDKKTATTRLVAERLKALLDLSSINCNSPNSSYVNNLTNELGKSFLNVLLAGVNAPAHHVEASNLSLLNSLSMPILQQHQQQVPPPSLFVVWNQYI